MDERLKKALDFSNFMITFENQKRIIKEQFENNVLYFFKGGQFTASPQLISFIHALIAKDQTEFVILDDNELPVLIEDLNEFLDNIVSTYATAANQYLVEYNTLKQKRSPERLVE